MPSSLLRATVHPTMALPLTERPGEGEFPALPRTPCPLRGRYLRLLGLDPTLPRSSA